MLSYECPPELPQRSLTSQAVLYRPLQDIEIYVEDEGSEVFYKELLTRLLGQHKKVLKVFPLRGRKNVLLECESYKDKNPAMFIIDGDLSWVVGEPQPNYNHLFINQCYCIENYLICENAMVEVAFENCGKLSRQEIIKKLDWSTIKNNVEIPLLELFYEFAVAHLLAPTQKTTSYGFDSVCTQIKKKSIPQFDSQKSSDLAKIIKNSIIQSASEKKYNALKKRIIKRVSTLNDPLDAVSV